MNNLPTEHTICAISTPKGIGGIAVIRLSGKDAFTIAGKVFRTPRNQALTSYPFRYAIFGRMYEQDTMLDEGICVLFQAPHSYTGENMVEISCHGSLYIQEHLLQSLITAGAVLAQPGEYTRRAFLNGKIDLTQAESIADLIASASRSAHKLALQNLKGGFHDKITDFRNRLMEFASLIELELDFSEEDVEFADRKALRVLLDTMTKEVRNLLSGFAQGNAMKHGIPVAIIGKPNVGKSTLLNTLLDDDRALVSDLPGTTRDTIEDVLILEGKMFRFIDTAGIRHTNNTIEAMGVEKTYQTIGRAAIILYVIDAASTPCEEVKKELKLLHERVDMRDKKLLILGNKIDLMDRLPSLFPLWNKSKVLYLSAKRKDNIQELKDTLLQLSITNDEEDTLLSNTRHYECLKHVSEDLENISSGLSDNLPGDLIAIDIRNAIYHLGEISGEITNEDILSSIFSNFCIGK